MGFINAGSFTAFRNDNKSMILPMRSLTDRVPQMYLTMKPFSHEGISGEKQIIWELTLADIRK